MKKIGWDKDLTEVRSAPSKARRQNRRRSWAVDLSADHPKSMLEHGVMAYCATARRVAWWSLPDPCRVASRNDHTARPELVAKYPTRRRRPFRVGNLGLLDPEGGGGEGTRQAIPIILTVGTSGRI